jgi:PAS domain S-box-containing protein
MLNAANNQEKVVSTRPVSALRPARGHEPEPTDRAARARRALSQVAWWANVLSICIVLVAMLGWIGDYPALRTLGADFPSLQLPTALLLLLAAGALAAVRRQTPAAQRGARIGATLVVIGAAGALALHAAGIEGGPELGLSAFAERGADLPARMSVVAAMTLLLVGAGIALTPLRTPLAEITHRVVALGVVGISFVAIVGLSFRLLLLYGVAPLFGMSLPSAIALLLFGVNLLAGRPDAWLLDVLTSDRPGAVISRWLLPAAVAVPLAAHWLQLAGQRSGVVDEPLGEAMLTVVTIGCLGALVLWVASEIDRMSARSERAEHEVHTQRESLQVVLASIGDGVIATDRAGAVRFVNPAAQRLTGRQESAATGRPVDELLDVIDERTGAALALPIERAVKCGETAVAEGEPALRLPGGRVHPVELSASPTVYPGGTVSGAVLVIRDAAGRREAERAMREAYAELDRRVIDRTAALERATAALRERSRLLETITSSTTDLIFAKDAQGRILMVNAAYLRVIGKDERDVIGRTSFDLNPDAATARVKVEHDRAVLASGRSLTVEEVFPGPAGPHTYLATKSPLRDEDGRIVGLVAFATDITDRKRAERELEILVDTEQRLRGEAERANRAKDEFLAIVSHELRSPLNALRGWGHLLASTRPLEAELVERATQAIKRNVEHQARLIDDILDTSRSMSGRLTLERHPVNLVDVVHAAVEIARPAASAKQIELRTAFDRPAITVEGDNGRLQQVVTNLLSNAIKFTPQDGTVETTVRLAGDRVRIAVSDNGAGISSEFLPHVFERFTQADTSTTRRAGGLGIGLALVRHLVELHGGEVRAESEGVGRGSVFTVDLPAPALVAPENRTPSSANEQQSGFAELSGLTVFLVDDDADARDIIGLALRQRGGTVETFGSGAALIARLERLPAGARPDALLLDLAMPDEDGFAVLGRVRAIESKGGGRGARIPAIAVTAFTEIDRQRLHAAGFQSRVGKPVDADRLVAAIRALVSRTDTRARKSAGRPLE